jgi:hypothetical protein
MSANPTSEEIMEAIRLSGHMLEQQVATQLEALNYHVITHIGTVTFSVSSHHGRQ